MNTKHPSGLVVMVMLLFFSSESIAQGNDSMINSIEIPVLNVETNVETARKLADQAISNEKKNLERIRNLDIPVLILEGDSWFDLPFHTDISDELEKLNYTVLSGASYGDTLENMAFNGQLEQLVTQLRVLSKYKRVPKAILLSVGGNDIIGPGLALILNHRDSSLGKQILFMQNVLDGIFKRFESYVVDYIAAISIVCHLFYQNEELHEFGEKDEICKGIPIIVHGYDYPASSGNGFKVLWYLTLAGPWLKPSFDMKNYSDGDATGIIRDLVDLHNQVISSSVDYLRMAMAREDSIKNPVCHLDLRNIVDGRWADELHPDSDAMKAIAQKFHAQIGNCTNS